jgi:hypothetical protein
MTTAEMRLDAGKTAGFRAAAQAKPRFPTPPARAQRDLPLHGRCDKAIMAPTIRNPGNVG